MIDLHEIQKYRENNRIEAKTALGGLPHSIWETYSAFANAMGGVILLGVRENKDKSLDPVDLPDPEGMAREFLSCVNDPKYASVNILSSADVMIGNVEGNRIIAVRVPRAGRLQKPVFVEGNLRNTFRRSGEGDYRCSHEEVEAMLRDAAEESPDMRVLEDLSCDDFCRGTVQRFREQLKVTHPELNQKRREFLWKIGAAAYGSDGELHPTAGGLLLFGKAETIRTVFPCFLLEYWENGSRRLSSESGSWSGNVTDFCFRLSRKLSGKKTEAIEGFSMNTDAVHHAMREALVNCLVNADYDGMTGVTVAFGSDSLVFSNPGTFRVNPEKVKTGRNSDPRNSVMHQIFKLLDVGKYSGSGLPGIYRAWKDAGREEPMILQNYAPDFVTLVLPLIPDDPETSGGNLLDAETLRQLVISFLTEKFSGTSAEIAGFIGVSVSRIRETLDRMIRDNLLDTEGSGRGKVYRLKR